MAKKVKNLMISIDSESLDIYIDKGEHNEPIHVCYWHIDEIEEDSTVWQSTLNAVQMFYEAPERLCKLMGVKDDEIVLI